MPTAKITIKDETNCTISGLDLPTRKKLLNKFKYEIPGARFTPACALGRWDGCKTFFSLGAQTYINLLPEILSLVDNAGYDVALEDLRTYPNSFVFSPVDENSYADKMWPVGHERAGTPILLRDYQVTAINDFLENTQSIQCLATGSGKCLSGETLLELNIDENTPFGRFMINKLQQGVESNVTKNTTNNTGKREEKLD